MPPDSDGAGECGSDVAAASVERIFLAMITKDATRRKQHGSLVDLGHAFIDRFTKSVNLREMSKRGTTAPKAQVSEDKLAEQILNIRTHIVPRWHLNRALQMVAGGCHVVTP